LFLQEIKTGRQAKARDSMPEVFPLERRYVSFSETKSYSFHFSRLISFKRVFFFRYWIVYIRSLAIAAYGIRIPYTNCYLRFYFKLRRHFPIQGIIKQNKVAFPI